MQHLAVMATALSAITQPSKIWKLHGSKVHFSHT